MTTPNVPSSPVRFASPLALAAALVAASVTHCGDHNTTQSTSGGVVALSPNAHVPLNESSTFATTEVSNPIDPNAPDAGLDAGLPDAGLTAGLPAENPICVGHMGPAATCWGEWLKEMGNVQFTAVAKGQLGAGPWSTTATATLATAQGLQLPVLYAGVDTGENIYAVSAGALFIMRPGETKFEEYDQNTNGLKNYPFQSVAGQAPGVAYVGHAGILTATEFDTPPTDPLVDLQSGGIDKVELTPTGISVTPYWTHNSNSPSGSYSHDRTLYNLFVPRRGPAAGELYSSSEHCITRRIDDTHYASHRHIDVVVDGVEHFGMARAVTVTDDGHMWYGSDYEFGSLAWQPRLYEWYFDNSWILPTKVYTPTADKDMYRGVGVDSNGDVWAAANGYGIAHLSGVDLAHNHAVLSTINPPDVNMNTLQVDTDDSIWVGADGGLYRYVPTTQMWTTYSAAGGGINHIFLDDTVTPRTLYVAGQNGIFVYRGE